MKKILLFFSICVITVQAHAVVPDFISSPSSSTAYRDSVKTRGNLYFEGGLNYVYHYYKDFIVSPNTYYTVGFSPMLNLGFQNIHQNSFGETYVLLGYGKMNTPAGDYYFDPPTQLAAFRLNNSRCFNLRPVWMNRIQWQFGYDMHGEFNGRFNTKFENSTFTYDIWLDAGVANRFEWPFNIRTEKNIWFIHFHQPQQQLRLSWQLNVPLFGIITRPNYAGITHFADGGYFNNLEREMTQNLNFTSFHNFIMVNSKLQLLLPLGNRNKLSLAYSWEGYRYNKAFSKVQCSFHVYELGMQFRLDGRKDLQ